MAKTSGRNVKRTGGFKPRDFDYKGYIKKVESLVNIEHREVYNEVKQAISRFEAELGVRERNVKLAEMEPYVNGVQMTTFGGENSGIYLNSKVFNLPKKDFSAE